MGLAALFWTVALAVLAFNLARQRWNRQATEGGAHVSGIPFLASLGIWIGAAASPLDLGWMWLLAVVVELPAVGDFVTGDDDTAANGD